MMEERGVVGEARRVAGLLRAGSGSADRRESALGRTRRIAAEACAGGPTEGAQACADLRDALFEQCERGALTIDDARALCREIDAAQAAALESAPHAGRALEALDHACATAAPEGLPALVLEGATAADSAALFIAEGGTLSLRAAAGLDGLDPAALAGPESIAAQAASHRAPIEASDAEGARFAIALPLLHRGRLLGVLRAGSRAAWQFPEPEKRFLRIVAARAASMLAPERARIAGGHEARLRHALRAFESLIETSPLPIVALDSRGLVQIWNHAAEEVFGWKREEVIGRPPPYVPPEEEGDALEVQRAALSGQMLHGREIRRARKDGSTVHLALSLAPLRDAAGDLTGSITILADITGRKRREAEEQETARFREQFVGIVGHDLRNPLTAIVSSAQMLLRHGGLTDKQSRVVGRVFSSADRMARMIDDLLDFARTRLGGGFPIQRRRVDLGELCAQAVDELEFAYPGREIRVQREGDLWGSWDPDRIAQVVSNLVGNALHHGPEDGPVRVSIREAGDEVVLETHNPGAPIPPEVLPHIFEPGRRGDARAGGLGLGLFIVRQVVLAHGGRIEARSGEADGTVFTVTLPRKARHKL
jgi:PAS domain S-box-containing protein